MLKRLYAPLPIIRHLGLRNGLDPSPDLWVGEIMGADPDRVQQTAHVANLVHTVLKRVDSAHDESPQEVVCAHLLLQQSLKGLEDQLDLRNAVLRVIVLV